MQISNLHLLPLTTLVQEMSWAPKLTQGKRTDNDTS